MGALRRRPFGLRTCSMTGRRGGAALAVVLALLAAALVPTSASAAGDTAPAAIPARYLQQQINWSKCDFSDFSHDIFAGAPVVNCASITVPMDWKHPDAHPDIKVAIAYSHATGTSKGLLAANPGGPGVKGLRFTNDLALSRHQMFTDYDLLGFDPRGFGDSQQLQCLTTVSELLKLPQIPDPRVRSSKTHAAELKIGKAFSAACSKTEFSQFVSTQQTVFDLEFLRQLLGTGHPTYDKLNYLGYSYGTWLGAWYADTYPHHTGRFVLDSNMSWTTTMYRNQTFDSFSFERRRDKMFYPWVARHNKTYGLGSTTAKVAKRYEKIRAALAKAWTRGDFVYSPAQADAIILEALYSDSDFPYAATQIIDLEGQAAGSLSTAGERRLAAAMRRVARQPEQSYNLRVLAQRQKLRARSDEDQTPVQLDLGGDALRCNDTHYSHDVKAVLKRADKDAKKYPFVGYNNTVSLCSYWKFSSSPRKINLPGVPRMLMFQSEGDPATAYEGARAAHKATASHTRLVSVDNEGQHGLYTTEVSPCVEKIGDAFLFNGVLPSKDKTCTASPLPTDHKVYKLTGPLDGKTYSLK